MIKYDNYDTSHEGEELREIIWYDKTPLTTGTLYILDVNSRLYTQEDKEHNSFDFCFVEFHSALVTEKWNGDQDVWECLEVTVNRTCFGTAAFDGIRHLYIPYAYYPNIPVLIKLFQKLQELQLEYCVGL